MVAVILLFWKLSVLAELALAVRLLLQGLGGKYPALLAGSCLFALRSALLIFSIGRTVPFFQGLWKFTEPLEWVGSGWIVLELFTHWTRNYPGIGRFGKLLLTVLLAIAILLSGAIWQLEWKSLVFADDRAIYYLAGRIVTAALALFMIATALFFSNYPAPVSPNVKHHTKILVFYLTSVTLAYLALNLLGKSAVRWTNLAVVISTTGSFLSWAVMMTRTGEVRSGGPKPPTPEQKDAIDRINERLLEFMKSFRDTVHERD